MRAGVRRRWARSRPGCGCAATTRSRTPAASARRRPRSSAGVALARALVAGGTAPARRRRRVPARRRARGPPRQRRAGAATAGFVISGRDEADFYAVPSAVDPRVGVVVFVPPDPRVDRGGPRAAARPVPHADAAANAGRTALLVAALAGPPRAPAGAPPATACTRTTGGRRCRPRWTWSTRCAPTASPPSSPVPGPTVLAFVDAGGGAEALRGALPGGWDAAGSRSTATASASADAGSPGR